MSVTRAGTHALQVRKPPLGERAHFDLAKPVTPLVVGCHYRVRLVRCCRELRDTPRGVREIHLSEYRRVGRGKLGPELCHATTATSNRWLLFAHINYALFPRFHRPKSSTTSLAAAMQGLVRDVD